MASISSLRLLVSALGVVGIAACAHSHPPARDLSPAPGTATALEVTQAHLYLEPRHEARLEVSEVEGEGVSAASLQSRLAPAAEPLHRCLPGRAPGKIILRVTRKDGVLSVLPLPGVSLDDAGRSCVFEALSRVELTETGSNTGGVSIPPSGFTSIVTVAW